MAINLLKMSGLNRIVLFGLQAIIEKIGPVTGDLKDGVRDALQAYHQEVQRLPKTVQADADAYLLEVATKIFAGNGQRARKWLNSEWTILEGAQPSEHPAPNAPAERVVPTVEQYAQELNDARKRGGVRQVAGRHLAEIRDRNLDADLKTRLLKPITDAVYADFLAEFAKESPLGSDAVNTPLVQEAARAAADAWINDRLTGTRAQRLLLSNERVVASA